MKHNEIMTDTTTGKRSLHAIIMSGFSDLREGMMQWRVWHLIGAGDLRRRYARSMIGQFWLTLSTGISVLIMAFVWSAIFKATLADMLPYMAVSIILWQFIAGIMSDATSIFSSNSHMLLNQRMVCSTIVIASVYRNFLTLLHNLIIIPIIFIVFLVPVKLQILLLIPSFVLIVITSIWVSYIVAALCARFRDFSNVLNSVMQLAFYVTPVIWKTGLLGENLKWVIWANPFTYFLNIMRSPILGQPLSAFDWVIPVLITFFGLFFSLIFIGKFRRQVLYWI